MPGVATLDSAALRAVLYTALDAVAVMRMDGTISGWNAVAEETFGFTAAEVLGRRMSEIIIPDRHRRSHEQGLQRFLASGEGPVLNRHIEVEALHKDGRELAVELSITHTEQFGEPIFLGFLRDITERRESERRQQLMIGELNHRVKNLLGVVSAIANQTARNADSIPAFIEAFSGRLNSLARAHEILTSATWQPASLRSLVNELLAPHLAGAGARAHYDGPDILLPSRQLLSMSMIIHELLTNAMKYGALSRPGGDLAVEWRLENDDLHFAWIETGLSDIQQPTRRGFGSKMIALCVSHDLRGRHSNEWLDDGMTFRLEFAVDKDVEAC